MVPIEETFVQTQEIINPTSGDAVDAADIDGLISAYEAYAEIANHAQSCKMRLAHLLASQTTADAKTRRLEGVNRRVKIEMPSPSWDQRPLKQLWEEYHQTLAKKYLRIDAIGVLAREFAKLETMTVPMGAQRDFQTVLLSARREPTGTPRIVIEL